jgi:hypothetical protein
MKKSSPQSIAENTEEMKEWEEELARLQKLVPIQASRDRLKNTELPALERQIKEQEGTLPPISKEAEQVSRNYDLLYHPNVASAGIRHIGRAKKAVEGYFFDEAACYQCHTSPERGRPIAKRNHRS